MPLLPHLSHGDGRKVDLAFFYRGAAGYAPGLAPSPIAYWAFETPRTGAMLRWLAGPGAEIGVRKILLEPHLAARLGATGPLVRFQGCRAARHDDHVHVDIAG